jgi:hypothetical protein
MQRNLVFIWYSDFSPLALLNKSSHQQLATHSSTSPSKPPIRTLRQMHGIYCTRQSNQLLYCYTRHCVSPAMVLRAKQRRSHFCSPRANGSLKRHPLVGALRFTGSHGCLGTYQHRQQRGTQCCFLTRTRDAFHKLHDYHRFYDLLASPREPCFSSIVIFATVYYII